MEKQLNEFYIQYSVDILARLQDDLDKLRLKLDPFATPEKHHFSIEERYAARELIYELRSQIILLKNEVDCHTGEEVKKPLLKKLFRK